MLRIALAVGGICGALAVAMAAIAAHAPAGARVDLLVIGWQIALPHAAMIIVAALVAERCVGLARRYAVAAVILFAAGTVIFPGSLYIAGFGGPSLAAPLGGMALILAWFVLVLAATRSA